MNWTTRLQKLGLLPTIFLSEVDEADSEDVLRTLIEQKRASDGSLAAAGRNQQANGSLREAVRRVRSSAFADFETSVRHGGIRDR